MRVPQGGNCFAVISSARFFAHKFDLERGEIVFVPATRDSLSRLAFIDGRSPLSLTDKEEIRISLETLFKAFENRTSNSGGDRRNFIFHTGFCCSTLIARCLDSKGAALSLKEPNILNDLSEAKRLDLGIAKDPRTWDKVCAISLELLFRRFSENELVLLKPSSSNNNLVWDFLKLNPRGNFLFVYSDLKSFLISVAKGGKPRRDFIRQFVAGLLVDLNTQNVLQQYPLPISRETLWNLSDLHIAAVAWHLQMQMFERVENLFPDVRTKQLDCEDFLSDPAGMTEALCKFFEIRPEDLKKRESRLEHHLLHHAKAQEFSYSTTIRQTEFMAIENYLGKTLDEVQAWVDDFLVPASFPDLPKVAI